MSHLEAYSISSKPLQYGASVGAAVPSVHFHNHSFSNVTPSQRQHIGGDQMRISHGPYDRKIHSKSRNVLGNREVAEKLRDVLEATYDGDASKHKKAALDANSSARAAENWFAADNPMNLTAFLNAYLNNPTFKAWAKKILLQEEDHDPEFQAQLAAFIRAAQKVGV